MDPHLAHHPTVPGSVMNYDDQVGISEGDCYPHPLDVMAIYALYQTVASVGY